MCTIEDTGQGEWQLFPPLSTEVEAVVRRLPENAGLNDIYAAIIESQCGQTDDSQAVEQYNGTLGVTTAFVNAHQAPVGQIQWNNNLAAIYTNPGNVSDVRWCTGALVSNDLFLTAGHCFAQLNGPRPMPTVPRINGTNDPIPPQEIATNMHVNFNYQVDPTGNLRQEQVFAIAALVEYRLGGLDFAIIRLAGNPGQTFGTGVIATADPQQNDMICIIGHPAGVPKRIEAGRVSGLVNNQIRYNDIDTLGGNSGSAIWHSPAGTIVGVHTNGGCISMNPESGNPESGFNFGVRISRLLRVSPVLQNLSLGLDLIDEREGNRDTAIAVDATGVVHLAYVTSDGAVQTARKEGTGYNRDLVDEREGNRDTAIAVDAKNQYISYCDHWGVIIVARRAVLSI